jgi:hypothetical protein
MSTYKFALGKCFQAKLQAEHDTETFKRYWPCGPDQFLPFVTPGVKPGQRMV